jgi:ABC-type Zn2+ transport system substrate-binding protein/surface adhesin
MFKKIAAWLKPSEAEIAEAKRIAQTARDIEHGHPHEHADGVIHAHDHQHADHDHDHDHDHGD